MHRALEIALSSMASQVRLWTGARVGRLGARPEQPLEVFEFEGCPYCRKAREALSILDLEALIRPCPKGGSRYRDEVAARGGKLQFPYLVDPNAGKEMYESDQIVAHLFERYASQSVPALLRPGLLTDATAAAASALRGGRGLRYRPARAPDELLELYGFEACPYTRLVREELSSLEIPYLLHNVARGSSRREALIARSGRAQVPFLVDPNTGTELLDSARIVRYLNQTYSRDRG